MTTCTRRLQWCMGHRVLGHEGKCSNLHGHNYVALITAEADELDDVGRVVDFSVLKAKYGGYIEHAWDHGFALCGEDPLLDLWKHGPLSEHKIYIMNPNPTAENIARHLLDLQDLLLAGSGVRVTEVTVWETENCYATARSTR